MADHAGNSDQVRAATTASTTRAVVAVLVVSTIVRLAAAALTPVLEAEAYYWLWSEQLEWGYLDHPPMVAVLMALGGVVAGDAPIGLRLAAVVLGTGGLWIFHRFCRGFVGDRTALMCLLFLAIAPVWLPFAVLTTPDTGLLFFWMAALAAFWAAYRSGGWSRWLLTGALTGLAILSKYNAFQLPGVFVVFLIATERGRTLLKGPKPWAAVALALAVAAPNLAWNAAHGGETLKTPLKDGIEFGAAAINVASWAALPLLSLTPLVGIAWISRSVAGMRAGRWRTDDRFLFLMCASWIPMAAFGVVSLVTQIHGHWVATCMLAAVPLAFEGWERVDVRPGKGFLRAGLIVAGLFPAGIATVPLVAQVMADATDPDAGGRSGENNPANARRQALEQGMLTSVAVRLRGDEELAARLAAEIEARGTEGWFLASSNYHLTSKIDWMARRQVPALPIRSEYLAQYAHWTDGSELLGKDALWVEAENTPGVRNRLRRAFESYERLAPIDIEFEGGPCRRWVLFWARGFRGPLD